MFNLKQNAQLWDAKYNLPRPANEQHLSSYKAVQRIIKDGGRVVGSVLFTIVSAGTLLITWNTLASLGWRLDEFWVSVLGLAYILLLVFLFLDAFSAWGPYRMYKQSETFGSARRATVSDLKKADLLVTRDELEASNDRVPLAFFGNKYVIAPKLSFWSGHSWVVGPPRSGKSASFFMTAARYFARCAGVVALDMKGEHFARTAHYFGDTYRVDLINSEFSDHLDLFAGCRGNSEAASAVASYVIGYDPNSKEGGGSDPFWKKAGTALLKLLILHLCEIYENPTPREIFQFMTENPAISKTPDGEFFNALAFALSNSPSEQVRREYGALFSTLSNKTFSSVAVTMLTDLEPFTDPEVQQLLTPPTPEEKAAGRRTIDFARLRLMHETSLGKRGTALYVVVPEKKVSRLEVVLAAIFALANDSLASNGSEDVTPVIFAFDEAGNCPLRKLSERVGIGRGLGLYYFLGYQSLTQPEKQYGKATASSILQSIGIKIFLPGLTGESARTAVEMIGKTTIIKREVTDAVKNSYDSERLSEVGRDLMDVNELRQMMKHTQCVIVIDSLPPIFARFPDNAKIVDPRESKPRQKSYSHLQPVFAVTRATYFKANDVALSATTEIDKFMKAYGELQTHRFIGQSKFEATPPAKAETPQPEKAVLSVFPPNPAVIPLTDLLTRTAQEKDEVFEQSEIDYARVASSLVNEVSDDFEEEYASDFFPFQIEDNPEDEVDDSGDDIEDDIEDEERD